MQASPSIIVLTAAAFALAACESPREDPATERPRDTVQPVPDNLNRSPDADAGVTPRDADSSRSEAPPTDVTPADADAPATGAPVER